jgi:hypothetical protein
MIGLQEFLRNDFDQIIGSNEQLHIPSGFIVPGYWIALTAYCRHKHIRYDRLKFDASKNERYASAIALEYALDGIDNYPYARRNSGRNYRELVHLGSAEDTDNATGTINSCIRQSFLGHHDMTGFVSDLCDVVGDLHDNVWSHGMSTGVSMAQFWENFSLSGYSFEFALADCGYGFLRELKRVGLSVNDDAEAIEWCIQKGNSSKKLKDKDDWGQRLPADIAGNPIPGIGHVVVNDNHHMGLGLAKLIELVDNYRGELWLASGETTLLVNQNGQKEYKNNKQKWQGVVLACRFDTERAKRYIAKHDDEITTSLIDLLRA